MDPNTLDEGRGRREALSADGPGVSRGSSPGENALPAEPIKGRLAFWIPKEATKVLMGATWLTSCRHQRVLLSSQALMFTFLGGDAPSRKKVTYLMYNTISPILIWTVESYRGGWTLEKEALHCIALTAIPFSGIETTAPAVFTYTMAAWDCVKSSEDPVIPSEVAKAVLPATLLGYALPVALVSSVSLTATGISRSHFNIQSSVSRAFLLAPATVALLTRLIASVIRHVQRKAGRAGPRGKGMPEDKISHQTRDASDVLHSLQLAYAVTFAIQATQHLYTIARNLIQAPRGQRSVVAVLGNLLMPPAFPRQKYSSLALYSVATLGFGLYTVWELRRRGKVTGRDAKRTAAGVLAGQVLFGPGATYAGLWWWREGVLAKTRQRV